jgi:hypothetical protein
MTLGRQTRCASTVPAPEVDSLLICIHGYVFCPNSRVPVKLRDSGKLYLGNVLKVRSVWHNDDGKLRYGSEGSLSDNHFQLSHRCNLKGPLSEGTEGTWNSRRCRAI